MRNKPRSLVIPLWIRLGLLWLLSGSLVACRENTAAEALDSVANTDTDADTNADTDTDSVVVVEQRIQAECAHGNVGDCNGTFSGAQDGTQLDNGDTTVGYIDEGDWLLYENVDFTGMDTLVIRHAKGSTGGHLEIRTGSITGPLIGTFTPFPTGGWDVWQESAVFISTVTGIHDLVFVGVGGPAGIVNLDWVELGTCAPQCEEHPQSCAVPAPLTGAGVVTLSQSEGTWTLYRDGRPYYVKGVGGQTNLAMAAASGANSTRTWGSQDAGSVLNNARTLGMTVLMGVWLSHNAADYNSDTYKSGIRNEVQTLLNNHRNHPALLMWALGNEINLGADTQAAWTFVNELALLVKSQDTNHPIMTVIAGANIGVMNNIATFAPAVDVIGVNSYGGVLSTHSNVNQSSFTGPYMITEWGPNGHWEVASTSWGRPIEQTSAAKALSYGERYDYIVSRAQRCLGSYVFLWGQKQERTPTWYGMFAETHAPMGLNGESLPTVDVMQRRWCGIWPADRAPEVIAMTLDGQTATSSVTLSPGQQVNAVVTASDPDGDSLTFRWEVLEEPTQLGEGGSFESRPPTVNGVLSGSGATVQLTAPTAGEYRIFAYALDGNGHVGTANIPFLVQ